MGHRVKLTPKRPPGRANRKALAFESEIGRLHALGYSCEAIRQALADAGLAVSRSTVTREVARHANRKHGDTAIGKTSSVVYDTSALLASTTSQPAPALDFDRRSGKEIAAAWFKDRNTNPLFRARSS